MVTKIVSRKSIRGLLNYNEQRVAKGQAHLVLASRFGAELDRLTFRQKLCRFEHLTMLNPRVKTNALHIMLNFEPTEKPETELLQQVASSYMERIGFGEQPYLVYRHLDTSHTHLHIVTTNIRADGCRINLHNIGRTLSEKARRELEIEFGLKKAEESRHRLQEELPHGEVRALEYGKEPTKRAIANIVTDITEQYIYASLSELNAVLRLYGVTADRGKEGTAMYRNKGLVYCALGSKGEKAGRAIKASSLPGTPTLANLEKRFQRNREKRMANKSQLASAIRQVLKSTPTTKDDFVSRLRGQNISAVFRENEQGFTYGVTFVDHRHKVVFNGSALGKEFRAKALLEHFRSPETQAQRLPSQEILTEKQYQGSEAGQHYQDSTHSSTQGQRLLEDLLAMPEQGQSPFLPDKKKKKRRYGMR